MQPYITLPTGMRSWVKLRKPSYVIRILTPQKYDQWIPEIDAAILKYAEEAKYLKENEMLRRKEVTESNVGSTYARVEALVFDYEIGRQGRNGWEAKADYIINTRLEREKRKNPVTKYEALEWNRTMAEQAKQRISRSIKPDTKVLYWVRP